MPLGRGCCQVSRGNRYGQHGHCMQLLRDNRQLAHGPLLAESDESPTAARLGNQADSRDSVHRP